MRMYRKIIIIILFKIIDLAHLDLAPS